jgi:hypothetical protein
MLSFRDMAGLLAVPEVTRPGEVAGVGLTAYRIGKHLRWR